MRALIAKEKGEADPWDLKLASGGVIDIEFIAQYLALRHAHATPEILAVGPVQIILNAGGLGLIAVGDADRLAQAHRLYSAVAQMMRLTTEGAFDPAKAAKGVLRRIAAVADCPDFPRLDRQLVETRKAVRALVRKYMD